MGLGIGRMGRIDARNASAGLLYIEFSAQLNGSSAPTLFRGDEQVTSFVYAGSTGTYTLTLSNPVREEVTSYADLQATGGGDGAYATISPPTNDAASPPAALVYTVYTHAASGALSNLTARRIKITLCLKISGVSKGAQVGT